MEPQTTCPDSETLAEFIDGTLDGPRRDAVIEHLADCEECREIFAGAVEFELSEQAVVVTPIRVPRSLPTRRWLPLAAMIVVAAALGIFGVSNWGSTPASPLVSSYFNPEVDPEALLAAVAAQQSNRGWSATRGGERGPLTDAAAFRIGVLLADIEASLLSGSAPGRLADALEFELSNVPAGEPLLRAYRNLWTSGMPPSSLLGESRRLERAMRDHIDSPYADLGSWAEAARLVIASGNAGYGDSATFREQAGRFAAGPFATETRTLLLGLAASHENGSLGAEPELSEILRRHGSGLR